MLYFVCVCLSLVTDVAVATAAAWLGLAQFPDSLGLEQATNERSSVDGRKERFRGDGS